jgi:hypothetical protein
MKGNLESLSQIPTVPVPIVLSTDMEPSFICKKCKFWVKETAMFFPQKLSYRNVFSHKRHLQLLEPVSFYMAVNILVNLCAVVVELIM